MRLLYVAPTKIEINRLDGVAKKIMDHVEVFSKVYDVLLLFRDAENVVIYDAKKQLFISRGHGKSKFDILRVAFSVIKKEQIDFCYIRYPYSDPVFLGLLKRMKKKKIRVVIEIPTYPYDAEGMESLKGRIIRRIDHFYRKKLKEYVGRIITYSDDDVIFKINTIRTVNGLDFERVCLAKPSYMETIRLCGVATFYRIHGYDRLIDGLGIYYKKGGKRNVIFDIVGDGDNDILQKYKMMVKTYKLEDKVIFHGRLYGSKLDEIYDLATIGVNSLAIHRQNLKSESTLKTREYAAKGLPILSSSYVDAFDDNGNSRYVFRVPAYDTPINIENIIHFYDALIENVTIEDLGIRIRNNARAVCDMPVTLKPVIDYLNSRENIGTI